MRLIKFDQDGSAYTPEEYEIIWFHSEHAVYLLHVLDYTDFHYICVVVHIRMINIL